MNFLRDSYDIGFQAQFNAEFPRQVINFSCIVYLNENREKRKQL